MRTSTNFAAANVLPLLSPLMITTLHCLSPQCQAFPVLFFGGGQGVEIVAGNCGVHWLNLQTLEPDCLSLHPDYHQVNVVPSNKLFTLSESQFLTFKVDIIGTVQ